MSFHRGHNGVGVAVPETNREALLLRRQINLLGRYFRAKGQFHVSQGDYILDDILIGSSPFRRIVQDVHNLTTRLLPSP